MCIMQLLRIGLSCICYQGIIVLKIIKALNQKNYHKSVGGIYEDNGN